MAVIAETILSGKLNPASSEAVPSTRETREQIIPQQIILKRPLVSKIRDGVIIGTKNWWENVNPAKWGDKSLAWRIGVAIGITETMVVNLAPVIPGKGFIKGGVNFAAMQGFYFAGNAINRYKERQINARFIGEERNRRLKEHQEAQARGKAKTAEFFKGLSAGATYASAGALILSVAESVATNLDINHSFNPFEPKLAEASGLHDTPPVGDEYLDEELQKIEKNIAEMKQNPMVLNETAASVGAHVDLINKTVDEVLSDNIKAAEMVSDLGKERIRREVLKSLEQQAYEQFTKAIDDADGDPQKLQEVISQGKSFFEKYLTTEASQGDLIKKAQDTLQSIVFKQEVDIHAAAAVGANLYAIDKVINNITSYYTVDGIEISAQAQEKMREAILHAMEKRANDSMDQVINSLTNNPDTVHEVATSDYLGKMSKILFEAKISSLEPDDEIIKAGYSALNDYYDGQHLAEAAAKATTKATSDVLGGAQQVGEAVAHTDHSSSVQEIVEAVKNNSSLYQEATIKPGDSLSQVLANGSGHVFDWSPKDVGLLGTHIFINQDLFKDHWLNLLSAGELSPSDLPMNGKDIDWTKISEWVRKAGQGDSVSRGKVLKLLHNIPVGMKINILSQSGIGATEKIFALAKN